MFWSDVTITSNPAASPIFRSSPFSSCGCHPRSTNLQTSCPDKKRRTPTGTFLSNRMRNSMALGVIENRLYLIGWQFKLLRDLGHANAIVEIIDNRTHRHPRPEQYRRAAMHLRLHFNQRTFRPINSILGNHGDLPVTLILSLQPKRGYRLLRFEAWARTVV
jgi:hypothetical protein